MANIARVTAYGGCGTFDLACPCPALETESFVSPEADPAPWYDADHPESGDFYGFLPESITLSVPASRPVNDVLGSGSVIGAERLPGRVIEVIGWMLAADEASMYWGERWLTQTLRGRVCSPGCQGDTVSLLSFCREPCTPSDGNDCYENVYGNVYGGPCEDCVDEFDNDWRTLVGARTVDGPRFSELQGDAASLVGQAQFQIASATPWLYLPSVTPVEAEAVAAAATACELVTTAQWFDGEALTLTVATADGIPEGESVTITITQSLDGTCPEDRVASSVTYEIGPLDPESSLTIDGIRRRVTYANPTSHRDEPGFDRVTWQGRFCYPIIAPCTSVCVCITNGSSSPVSWTLERTAREL